MSRQISSFNIGGASYSYDKGSLNPLAKENVEAVLHDKFAYGKNKSSVTAIDRGTDDDVTAPGEGSTGTSTPSAPDPVVPTPTPSTEKFTVYWGTIGITGNNEKAVEQDDVAKALVTADITAENVKLMTAVETTTVGLGALTFQEQARIETYAYAYPIAKGNLKEILEPLGNNIKDDTGSIVHKDINIDGETYRVYYLPTASDDEAGEGAKYTFNA